MKIRVFMWSGRESRVLAVWRGPIVLVVRWCVNDVKELRAVIRGMNKRRRLEIGSR